MNGADDLPQLTPDNLSAFDSAPQVTTTSRPWIMPLGVACAIGLGLLTFSMMSAGRAEGQAPEPPPEITPAPEPAQPAPAPVGTPLANTPAPMPIQSDGSDARLRAPVLIVDLSDGDGANAQGLAAAISGDGLSNDERFAARFGGTEMARARPLANPQTTIPEGVIITAVLETAINSDLPGYVRALVSRDVTGFDGSTVLIPRGSRLVGQYRSGLAVGQSRAFVIWTRLMRPDGVTIELNSPGADALGRGGLAGRTDRHVLRRFGGAVLLTLLDVAANTVGDSDNTEVIVGVSNAAADAAAVALHEEIGIPPTVHVTQGTPIRVFVSRDLDFSSVSDAP